MKDKEFKTLEEIKEFIGSVRLNLKNEIRKEATRALGQIEDDRILEVLISLLQDEYQDVRKLAAYFLERIEHPKELDPIIKAIKSEEKNP